VGEVVTPGQPVVTLINQTTWVRADVEETYVDVVRLATSLRSVCRRATNEEGIVFYRGVDASFATQRERQPHQARHQDVRGPSARRQRDRRLASGMTPSAVPVR